MQLIGKEFTTIGRYDFVGKGQCRYCGKDTSWRIVKIRYWITILNIPVFPADVEYRIVCYRCYKGKQIDEKTFDELRITAKKNKKAKNSNESNKIKELKYVSRTKTQQKYLDEMKRMTTKDNNKSHLGKDGKLIHIDTGKIDTGKKVP